MFPLSRVISFFCVISCIVTTLCASDNATTLKPTSPWSDTFIMPLRNQERTFVRWNNDPWLIITTADCNDPTFLAGKEATIIGKLLRYNGSQAWFYNLPMVEVLGKPELWKTHIDGDNIYLFGHFVKDAELRFNVIAAESAPSDKVVIATRVNAVKSSDWDGRLAVADWVRAQANEQGNREYWLTSADTIVIDVIESILSAAAPKADLTLIMRAINLSSTQLHDAARVAEIASLPWVRKAHGNNENIALRLHQMGYTLVAGRWLPQSEATNAEFEARFNALIWNDADGFYRLGLWCDANADLLPHARELSYRCFQSGFSADSRHNGIRRELGMEAISEKATPTSLQGDFTDSSSEVVVKGPEGWKRTAPINGDATWIDSKSETSYISARVIHGELASGIFTVLWADQISIIQARTEFKSEEEVDVPFTGGQARHIRFSYKEGAFVRFSDLVVIHRPGAAGAIRLESSYAETEQDDVRKNLLNMISKATIPIPEPVKPRRKKDNATKPTPKAEVPSK